MFQNSTFYLQYITKLRPCVSLHSLGLLPIAKAKTTAQQLNS